MDLEEAYVKLIGEAIGNYDVDGRSVNIVTNFYSGISASVRVNGCMNERREMNVGTRQGYVLLP